MSYADDVRGPGGRWGCWACLAAFLVVLLLAYGFSTHYLPLMRFTSEGWRRGGGEDTHSPVRLQMIDWLIRSGQLDGLTRPEVVALLGPADDTPYFSDWDFVYLLGPERGFLSIDSEWAGDPLRTERARFGLSSRERLTRGHSLSARSRHRKSCYHRKP